jgi:hypothetical protein
VTNIVNHAPLKAEDIMAMVQSWPMFGPWIAFKAADMIDRCTVTRVVFPDTVPLLYDSPREGLALLANHFNTTLEDVHSLLSTHFRAFKAPPKNERPCGPQELETILCKWKSSLNDHYFIGKDIREVRHALTGWGATAARLLAHMPKDVYYPEELA